MNRGVLRYSACLTGLVACLSASAGTAGNYPLTLTLEANGERATTKVASSVTVRVNRLMEENRRKRVADALKYSGYGNFLTALRALPAIGAIELDARRVEIRYAIEQQEATGRRLVLAFAVGNAEAAGEDELEGPAGEDRILELLKNNLGAVEREEKQ